MIKKLKLLGVIGRCPRINTDLIGYLVIDSRQLLCLWQSIQLPSQLRAIVAE